MYKNEVNEHFNEKSMEYAIKYAHLNFRFDSVALRNEFISHAVIFYNK